MLLVLDEYRIHSATLFEDRHVVLIVPLTVINDITFSPTLSSLKMEALSVGSNNVWSKVHSDHYSSDNIS